MTNEEITEMRKKCLVALSKGISIRSPKVDYTGIAACAQLLLAQLKVAEANNGRNAGGSGGSQSHSSSMVV